MTILFRKRREEMQRYVKVIIKCPVEIDDDLHGEELDMAINEAVGNDIFSTTHLSRFEEYSVEDLGEWNEEY